MRIFSYSGQYKKYLVFAALCITAESLFELVIPLIMANIVDIGVASGDRTYIFEQGAWMLVCAFLALLLGIGSAKFSAVAGRDWARICGRRSMQSFSSSPLRMWIIFSSPHWSRA